MSKEEKVERTKDYVESLHELRDEKSHAERNTNMAKFQDARANLAAIHHEVRDTRHMDPYSLSPIAQQAARSHAHPNGRLLRV